jgi:hypothetical protein
VKEALTLVAMLTVEHVLVLPPHAAEGARQQAAEAHRCLSAVEGDLPSLVNIYDAWVRAHKDSTWCRRNFLNARNLSQAHNARQQLQQLLKRMSVDVEVSCGAERDALLRCLACALFLNAARRTPDKAYATFVNPQSDLHIHPSSALFGRNPPPTAIIYCEVVHTSKRYMRGLAVIKPEWLSELLPKVFGTNSKP